MLALGAAASVLALGLPASAQPSPMTQTSPTSHSSATSQPRALPAAGEGRPAPARGWAWPLAGQPELLRPFHPPPQRWAPGHRGVDLAAEPGSPVLSPADGVVVVAGTVVDRGVVSVLVGTGVRTTLEPVAASVAVGDVVRRGEQVGVLQVRPWHCPARPCLHWGVRVGRDAYRDPLAMLRPPAAPVLLPLHGPRYAWTAGSGWAG